MIAGPADPGAGLSGSALEGEGNRRADSAPV